LALVCLRQTNHARSACATLFLAENSRLRLRRIKKDLHKVFFNLTIKFFFAKLSVANQIT
ncbi:MAG: hypothetical protein AAB851_04025, partial [Patescibacteria group bacterium]